MGLSFPRRTLASTGAVLALGADRPTADDAWEPDDIVPREGKLPYCPLVVRISSG